MLAVRGKCDMKSRQIHPRFAHQSREPVDEVHWLENNVRSAIAVSCLELVANVAIWRERQPLLGKRRAADVAVQLSCNRQEWCRVTLNSVFNHITPMSAKGW